MCFFIYFYCELRVNLRKWILSIIIHQKVTSIHSDIIMHWKTSYNPVFPLPINRE